MIFIFFMEGGGRGAGVLGALIGGSEPEWDMRRTSGGDRRGALCTRFTLVKLKERKKKKITYNQITFYNPKTCVTFIDCLTSCKT